MGAWRAAFGDVRGRLRTTYKSGQAAAAFTRQRFNELTKDRWWAVCGRLLGTLENLCRSCRGAAVVVVEKAVVKYDEERRWVSGVY